MSTPKISADLAAFARQVLTATKTHFPYSDLRVQQTLALAEEAGEFTKAFRRWAGMARRTGSWQDVEAELADVLITTYVTAALLQVDLDDVERKRAKSGKLPLGTPSEQYSQVMALYAFVGQYVELTYFNHVDWGSPLPSEIAGDADLGRLLSSVAEAAYVTADVLGIDLHVAWQSKAHQLVTRGWRDAQEVASEVARRD